MLLVATLGSCVVILAAVGWARRWWSPAARLQYASLAAAVALLVVQLGAWRLIGWGLT